MVCMCILGLCKPAYLLHYLLGEAHGSLGFLLGRALYVLHVRCLPELKITPCTLEPVHWFAHCALWSWSLACGEEQAARLQAFLCVNQAAPLYLAQAAWFCSRVHTKTVSLCSEAAWLTQQIGNSSVFPCWRCAVILLSHYIVSIISGAHMWKEGNSEASLMAGGKNSQLIIYAQLSGCL